MTSQAIHTDSIDIFNENLRIDAYLAAPIDIKTLQTNSQSQLQAIVVLQEIFGINAHIRDVTERFAKEGYVAIAPALYQRLAPGFATGYTPDDVKQGRIYKEQTRANELLGDIQAAIAYLKTLPAVNPEAIGCIGFCFGGHVAYLAATLPEIKATASFYSHLDSGR
jgi:carboxymethylenebutenolidase